MKSGELRAHVNPPGMYLLVRQSRDDHTEWHALVIEGHHMANGWERPGEVCEYSSVWLSMFTTGVK